MPLASSPGIRCSHQDTGVQTNGKFLRLGTLLGLTLGDLVRNSIYTLYTGVRKGIVVEDGEQRDVCEETGKDYESEERRQGSIHYLPFALLQIGECRRHYVITEWDLLRVTGITRIVQLHRRGGAGAGCVGSEMAFSLASHNSP